MNDFQVIPTEHGFQTRFTAPPYAELLPGGQPRTTLWQDFAIANAYGIPSIKDTFDKVMKEWGKDIDFMIELVFCVNTFSWAYWSRFQKSGKTLDKQISQLYADYYGKVQDHVYGEDSPFTKEEQSKYFEITD